MAEIYDFRLDEGLQEELIGSFDGLHNGEARADRGPFLEGRRQIGAFLNRHYDDEIAPNPTSVSIDFSHRHTQGQYAHTDKFGSVVKPKHTLVVGTVPDISAIMLNPHCDEDVHRLKHRPTAAQLFGRDADMRIVTLPRFDELFEEYIQADNGQLASHLRRVEWHTAPSFEGIPRSVPVKRIFFYF